MPGGTGKNSDGCTPRTRRMRLNCLRPSIVPLRSPERRHAAQTRQRVVDPINDCYVTLPKQRVCDKSALSAGIKQRQKCVRSVASWLGIAEGLTKSKDKCFSGADSLC